MPKSAVVFPLYIAEPDHFRVAKECYEKLQERKGDTEVICVMDGILSPEAQEYWLKEREEDRCMYISFGCNSGLTRSWNAGADLAIYRGADVILLSNQDAYPDTEEDLTQLIEDCYNNPDVFAVGPKTNNPGHMPAQTYDGRGEGLLAVPFINGFTWAVRADNVKKVIEDRKFFLHDSKLHHFHFGEQKTIYNPGLRPHEALSMVGQEDEICAWARNNGFILAISNGSYWYHEKLSLFRLMV